MLQPILGRVAFQFSLHVHAQTQILNDYVFLFILLCMINMLAYYLYTDISTTYKKILCVGNFCKAVVYKSMYFYYSSRGLLNSYTVDILEQDNYLLQGTVLHSQCG